MVGNSSGAAETARLAPMGGAVFGELTGQEIAVGQLRRAVAASQAGRRSGTGAQVADT